MYDAEFLTFDSSVQLTWPVPRCASGYQFMVTQDTSCNVDCLADHADETEIASNDDEIYINKGINHTKEYSTNS